MNPAAPRQFGAFGGPRPQLSARPMQQNMGAPPRPMPPRAPQQGNPMMGARMGAAMMSDERSKKRIQELENLNEQYSALLDTPAATANVRPQAPPTADLDRSNARALGEAGSYSYEYKDPGAPGAAPGRQAGPMAQELEGIPGVVKPGPDGFKRVDTGRLALATASATGDQERRLRQLEELNRDYEALNEGGNIPREKLQALGDGTPSALREGGNIPRERLSAMGSEENAQLSRELDEAELRELARIRGAR
jgi:hypothetical protein